MTKKFWELDKLENLFLNDKGHLRYEVVYTVVIVIALNIFSFIKKLFSHDRMKKRLQNKIFNAVVKFQNKQDELQKGIDETVDQVKEMKKIPIEVQKELQQKPAQKEEINKKLTQVKELDKKAEETRRVSGNHYYEYESELTNYIKDQSKDFMYSNPLHFDQLKGTLQIESELISWLLKLFNAPKKSYGSTTSGGTESILLAMLTYREYARDVLGIDNPEVVANRSIHVAFQKAAFYLDFKIRYVDIDPVTGLSRVEDLVSKINRSTVAIALSGMNYAHGLADQIQEINKYLENNNQNVWIHVDSCLGGYVSSASALLNDNRFEPMDFRLSRVGTISVDPHKYGRSPKGCSVLLFRNATLKAKSVYISKDWNGGVYITPTFAGSRSSHAIVGAWIAMKKIGLDGICEMYKKICKTVDHVREGLKKFDELQIIGEPKGCAIAFTWKNFDFQQLTRFEKILKSKGWGLPLIQNPYAIHITITLANCDQLLDNFLDKVKESLDQLKNQKDDGKESFSKKIYGTLLKVPNDDYVNEVLCAFQVALHSLDLD